MLTPHDTLQSSGFSQSADSGGVWEGWSAELISRLDWLRVAELARALAAHGGCELAGARIFSDGAVMFAMVENPRSAQPRKALVKIAGWNDWGATPAYVTTFADEVRTARDARGILIAPGGFSPASLQAAGGCGIEAVDAARLAETLRSLPSDKSDLFHVLATSGDSSTPTCPVCMQKMRRQEETPAAEVPLPTGEYIFQAGAIVAEPVACRRIEVMPGCEVQFLHEVRALEIIVHGHVRGDFVCEGPVTLEKTATLTGTVAARAIHVRDGARLLGRTHILEGDLQPVVPHSMSWFWTCQNPVGRPRCRTVLFEPH